MRRSCLSLLVVGLAATLTSVRTEAQPVGAPSIATPQQTAALLDERGIVVLHVGDKAEYDREHLPGARHLELRQLAAGSGAGALSLQLPTDADLEARLEALGIGDETPVVVYWGKDQVSPATRVVFTLDYAGLGGQTFVMDGGLPAWKAAGLPVTSVVPPAPAPGTLSLAPRREAVAEIAQGRERLSTSGATIIDARASEFYTGASDNNGRIPRPGHIAGAASLPYTTFLREDGRFKPEAEVRAMFASTGAVAGGTVITYCHIGQQATVPWMLARILGYDARLFDGSFEEWARTADAPVRTGTDRE